MECMQSWEPACVCNNGQGRLGAVGHKQMWQGRGHVAVSMYEHEHQIHAIYYYLLAHYFILKIVQKTVTPNSAIDTTSPESLHWT